MGQTPIEQTTVAEIKSDEAAYARSFSESGEDSATCQDIERRYGLEDEPPSVVLEVLARAGDGEPVADAVAAVHDARTHGDNAQTLAEGWRYYRTRHLHGDVPTWLEQIAKDAYMSGARTVLELMGRADSEVDAERAAAALVEMGAELAAYDANGGPRGDLDTMTPKGSA